MWYQDATCYLLNLLFMPRNIPPSPCPACQTMLDSATSLRDKKDKPDKHTLTVCFSCGELLRFDNDMKHERIPESMLREIKKEDPDSYGLLMHAQEAVRVLKKELGQKPPDN